MNYSFHTGTFARACKIAKVTPVLKSGNSEDTRNNRPISLLPILSKVSEQLAHGQFVNIDRRSLKLVELYLLTIHNYIPGKCLGF